MTTTMLDFEQIKADNPIEQVAERLGLTLKKNGNQYRGPCPSGAEGDRKLVITPQKGVWYSFAEQKGGDVISLVQFVNGVSAREAAAWIAGDTVPEKKRTERTSPERRGRGFSPLTYLEPDHEAVTALGFNPETAHQLGVGYAPRGVLKGTVAVPIRNGDGSIAGYLGLTEIEKLPPKWDIVEA